MKNVSLKNLAIPVAATALTVAVVANAAITPAFPTVSETFAVDGEIIHAADVNKLAEGINNLDQRSWIEGAGYMSAPNAVDGVVVTDDGNVGIGTDTPSQRLVLSDNDPYLLINDINTGGGSGLAFADNGITEWGITRDGTDNRLKFFEQSVGEHLTILEGGNVGIGTTTPSAKLEVLNTSLSSSAIKVNNSSGNQIFSVYENDDNSGAITVQNDDESKVVHFSTKGTNHSYINANNVGIGTTTPEGSLHVSRLNSDHQLILERTGTATAKYRFGVQNNKLSIFDMNTSNANALFTISDDGNIGIGTTTPNAKLHVVGVITETSDERLKENITPVANALDKITQLNGVSFDWIDKEKMDDNTHLGLIAQNVETVFPELVFTEETEFGTKSVNYDGLAGPMVEAIKELKAENELLKSALCEEFPGKSVCQ